MATARSRKVGGPPFDGWRADGGCRRQSQTGIGHGFEGIDTEQWGEPQVVAQQGCGGRGVPQGGVGAIERDIRVIAAVGQASGVSEVPCKAHGAQRGPQWGLLPGPEELGR